MRLALIPARAGSKGIPGKNIKPICGKPLIQWTIECALSSSEVDRVVVSTDSQKIADIAIKCGAEVPFLRPAHLAADNTPGLLPALHVLDNIDDVTDLLLLQPTSPLRTPQDISNILDIRIRNQAASAVSVCPSEKHPSYIYTVDPTHKLVPSTHTHQQPLFRQSVEQTYTLNGALFSVNPSHLLASNSFIDSDTAAYVMPPERSIDIDTEYDWKIAEFLLSTVR